MAIIELSRSILGFVFVMRTIHVFRARNIASVRALEIGGVVSLILISLIGALPASTLTARSLLTLVIAAAFTAAAMTSERRKLSAFAARVPLFVDKWILNLRLGLSTGAARANALRGEDPGVQALLRPIFESTARSRGKHPLLSSAARRELEAAATAPHGALARLEMLREQLRDQTEFRRKSGQAVRQSVIQSTIMLILLIALAGYTIHRYGWSRNGDLVTVAIALSLVGTALMARLSKKGEWKL